MFSGDDPALDQGGNAEDGVPPPPPPLSDHPAAKRQKMAGKSTLSGQTYEVGNPHSTCPSQRLWIADTEAEEVRVVMERLIAHISKPRKFKKASPLLRQLLKENKVSSAHSALLFQVY